MISGMAFGRRNRGCSPQQSDQTDRPEDVQSPTWDHVAPATGSESTFTRPDGRRTGSQVIGVVGVAGNNEGDAEL
jgi:hypothetical protein